MVNVHWLDDTNHSLSGIHDHHVSHRDGFEAGRVSVPLPLPLTSQVSLLTRSNLLILTDSFFRALLFIFSPFGLDKVDVPMEAFCATIEAQVHAIDERSKSIITAVSSGIQQRKNGGNPIIRRRSSATFHIPKLA